MVSESTGRPNPWASLAIPLMLQALPLLGLCFHLPGLEFPPLLRFACSESSQFLRLNSRATSSRKPCLEKASALHTPWAFPTAVLVGTLGLILVSMRS